jgi:hypothetical protein
MANNSGPNERTLEEELQWCKDFQNKKRQRFVTVPVDLDEYYDVQDLKNLPIRELPEVSQLEFIERAISNYAAMVQAALNYKMAAEIANKGTPGNIEFELEFSRALKNVQRDQGRTEVTTYSDRFRQYMPGRTKFRAELEFEDGDCPLVKQFMNRMIELGIQNRAGRRK